MSGERPCEVCQSITDGTYSPGDDCLGDPGCCEQPMTAERVQRELAEALDPLPLAYMSPGAVAAVLLAGPLAPLLAAQATVQRVEALADELEAQARADNFWEGSPERSTVRHIRRALGTP